MQTSQVKDFVPQSHSQFCILIASVPKVPALVGRQSTTIHPQLQRLPDIATQRTQDSYSPVPTPVRIDKEHSQRLHEGVCRERSAPLSLGHTSVLSRVLAKPAASHAPHCRLLMEDPHCRLLMEDLLTVDTTGEIPEVLVFSLDS